MKILGNVIDDQGRCKHYFKNKIPFQLNLNAVESIILAINVMRKIQIILFSHGRKRTLMKRQYFVAYVKVN